MTNPSPDRLFRQAAEEEGGMALSAGARLAHVRLALDAGQAVTVDLSEVPEDRRSALASLLRDMVKPTSTRAGRTDCAPVPGPLEIAR